MVIGTSWSQKQLQLQSSNPICTNVGISSAHPVELTPGYGRGNVLQNLVPETGAFNAFAFLVHLPRDTCGINRWELQSMS